MGEADGGGEKKNTFKNSAFQTGTDWFAIGKLQEVEKYQIKIKKTISRNNFLQFPLSKNVLDAMRKCVEA